MKRVNKRKLSLLAGFLTVSLASVPMWTILAEEKESAIDQYMIIELTPIADQEADMQETDTEASTESQPEMEQPSETAELETEADVSDLDTILFSLEDSFKSNDYSITGISVDEPIIAQLLVQTIDYQDYDSFAVYDLISHQQTADELYDFNLQISNDAEVTLYQMVESELQENPLDVMYAAEEYNRLPLISYQAETNHWLIIYLGSDKDASDFDTEDVAKETESAAESLEGQTEDATDPMESSKDVSKASENDKTPEKSESTTVSETKPAQTVPATVAQSTAPATTVHTHTWVAINSTIHHDAVTSQVWKEDSAAWDETVVTKAAWDENVLAQDAYDENKLVQDAYDEPVYGWVGICNACGYVFQTGDDVGVHMAAGCWSSWHDEWRPTGEVIHHDAVYQTVHHDVVYQTIHHDTETTIVHHEATGHYETVVTQDAWDETVTTGYTCSGCGVTK